MSILNQLKEDLKVIFLTETKCKIRFLNVRLQRKKLGINMSGKSAIGVNVFNFFTTSLMNRLLDWAGVGV